MTKTTKYAVVAFLVWWLFLRNKPKPLGSATVNLTIIDGNLPELNGQPIIYN